MFSIDNRKTSSLARFNVAPDMFVVLVFVVMARGRVLRSSRCSECGFIRASRVITLFYIDVSLVQIYRIHQFVETMDMVGIEKDHLARLDILWASGVGIVSLEIRLPVRRGDDDIV